MAARVPLKHELKMQELEGTADWRVSVAQLALFLELTERRVQQLAADGVIPAGEGGQYWFLVSLKGYVSFLQQAAAGKAVSEEGKEKQRAQIDLLQAQRDTAQMVLDEKRGALIPVDAVRASTVQLLKVLTEGADSLPDLLERKTGITGVIVAAVNDVCDQWRLRLYERATQILGGEVIADQRPAVQASALVEEVEAQPAKRRVGRPRKNRPDAFTPSLI
jgi:phage terminase Nu1 subunit (DNA packaging protein)